MYVQFQAFLIAVTAQFIPLQIYQYRDLSPHLRENSPAFRNDNLQKSLGGYVQYSLSEFPISALLNDSNNPFPLASAVALKFYNETDEPTQYFYQPYHVSIECFIDEFGNDTIFQQGFEDEFPYVIIDNNRSRVEQRPYFSEELWDSFTSAYRIDPGGPDHDRYRRCVNDSYLCR